MTKTPECQKWKPMSAWSTVSFSRPTVTKATLALVLTKNAPLDKKILKEILLIFRKRVLPKFVTWLCLWQVRDGNDFFAAGIQYSACFTNFLHCVSQATAKGKASPCQVFWKINKSTAIILTASTDKCNKRQDTKPRFPNGIASSPPFFFFFCLWQVLQSSTSETWSSAINLILSNFLLSSNNLNILLMVKGFTCQLSTNPPWSIPCLCLFFWLFG